MRDAALAADRRDVSALSPTASIDVARERHRLTAALKGDGDAFADVFLSHDRPLRLLAYQVLRDPDLVDDALQEAAFRAFRSLRSFRADSSVGTWLYRITYSVCIDMLKARRRQQALAEVDLPTPTSGPDPANRVAARDELSAALSALTPEQRAVVVLVLQQDLDLKTASTILGIPKGTVGSRLFTARRVLRRALGLTSEDDDG